MDLLDIFFAFILLKKICWLIIATTVFLFIIGLYIYSRKFTWKKYVNKFVVFSVILLLVELSIEAYINHRYQEDERVHTLQRLIVTRAKLESILNNNLSLLRGMGIAISGNPNLSSQLFNLYAREALRNDSLLLNIGAAPDLVIKYIYPLKGNEKALGLDYNKNAEQRKEVLQLKRSRGFIVVGPINLVQGGKALIGRTSVYYFDKKLDREVFWGILSAPVRINDVIKAVNGTDSDKEPAIALRKQVDSTLIYGQNATFENNPVIVRFEVAGEIWELGSQAEKNPVALSQALSVLRIAFLIFCLLLLTLFVIRVLQALERTKFIDLLTYRENILERVGSIANVGGWEYCFNKGFIFWSNEIYEIFDIDKKRGMLSLDELKSFCSEKDLKILNEKFTELLSSSIPFEFELPITLHSQLQKWVHILAEKTQLDDERISIQGVMQDITERKKAAQIILEQASFDSLTKLANRNLFDDRLKLAVIDAKRRGECFALLYIDLDRFKIVNDSLGHAAGDKLLVACAERFSGCIRETDLLSRRSGDEFTLIVYNLNPSKNIELVAQNILQQVRIPIEVDDNQVSIGASIGITLYPNDGASAEQLLKNADRAMYSAKDKGRNRFSYFTTQMQVESDRRLQLHIDMTEAIESGSMQVFYQPIFDMQSGLISECEALIRWTHPELGSIPAQELVNLAEDVGLITDLGQFVMTQAIADILEINKKYKLDIGLALNKSYREFLSSTVSSPSWVAQLKTLSNKMRVTIEITESLLVDDNSIYEVLQELRDEGVKLAIDDFGTGYSSLSYLRRFPVDQLKIDRSFINNIDHDEEGLALVEIILAMAKNLHLEVVAEGVETLAQLDLLKSRQCGFSQGFYMAKPMSKSDFEQWLQTDHQF
jgi:diguanylate cyclase (GGDEF)-like protein